MTFAPLGIEYLHHEFHGYDDRRRVGLTMSDIDAKFAELGRDGWIFACMDGYGRHVFWRPIEADMSYDPVRVDTGGIDI